MQKVIENVFLDENYLNLCKVLERHCEASSELFVDILATIPRILSSYERAKTRKNLNAITKLFYTAQRRNNIEK
jgi:hypothetical protein